MIDKLGKILLIVAIFTFGGTWSSVEKDGKEPYTYLSCYNYGVLMYQGWVNISVRDIDVSIGHAVDRIRFVDKRTNVTVILRANCNMFEYRLTPEQSKNLTPLKLIDTNNEKRTNNAG